MKNRNSNNSRGATEQRNNGFWKLICSPDEGGGFGNQIAILSILFFFLVVTVIVSLAITGEERIKDSPKVIANASVMGANHGKKTCVKTKFSEYFDSKSENDVRVAALISSIFSIAGSLFIVFSWVIFPRLRTFPFRLVLYLSIADVGASVAFFFAVIEKGINISEAGYCKKETTTCVLSGFFMQFFEVAGFFWILNISINLYLILVRKVGNAVFKYEKLYHLLAWGVSLVLACIPLFYDAYGDAGNWCWVQEDFHAIRMVIYFCPMVLIMLAASFNFLQSSLNVRPGRGKKGRMETNRIKFRLHMYILVYVILNFFPLLNRIYNAVEPNRPDFTLYLLQSIIAPLQGFGNAVIYGLNKAVVSHYKVAFSDMCNKCCFRSSKTEDQNVTTMIRNEEDLEDRESNRNKDGGVDLKVLKPESVAVKVPLESRSPWEGMRASMKD